jgi:abhydrolase domain-containing protein 17
MNRSALRAFLRRWVLGDATLKRVLRSVILVYLLLLVFAMLLSERLIFLPPASSYRDRPDTLKLTNSQGAVLSAVYLPQPKPSLTLLFSHGNAEDLGYVRPDLDRFHALGFAVFAYDYQGYGTSQGSPSEKGAYADIDAAYFYLTNTLGIPPERVVAYGRSLGGGPSVDLAARRPLRALVLESTFVTTFRVLTRFPLFPFDRFRNIDKIKRVQCPVLVMHGTADSVVAYWHGPALFEAAPEPRKFWRAEGRGHLDLMDAPGYDETLLSFVKP